MPNKILVIGGIARSLVNFRGTLLLQMQERGLEVLACAGDPCDRTAAILRQWGVHFMPVRLSRAGTSGIADLVAWRDLRRVLREVNPDVVLAYTIKPVIYGGFAARGLPGTRTYSLITGLGYAFWANGSIRQSLVGAVARQLYRRSLRSSEKVFFQNPDDLQEFEKRGLVDASKGVVVNGSGVDLAHYEHAPLPEAPSFLFVGRLLSDKGIREYLRAAASISGSTSARCDLVGSCDPNPASLSEQELAEWLDDGIVSYQAKLEDIRPAYRNCSVYVLPSYREGTPRTVLEAMSMGRPIITTDAPGCRETVAGPYEEIGTIKRGRNGFLVPIKDAEALAVAMKCFVDEPELIVRMGAESRRIAEEKYDVHKVNQVMLETMGL